MNYQKRIAQHLTYILQTVSFEDRYLKIHEVSSLVERIQPTMAKYWAKHMSESLGIATIVFGEWGECGLAVFFNPELKEVIRLAFEDRGEGKIRSWIVPEKQ